MFDHERFVKLNVNTGGSGGFTSFMGVGAGATPVGATGNWASYLGISFADGSAVKFLTYDLFTMTPRTSNLISATSSTVSGQPYPVLPSGALWGNYWLMNNGYASVSSSTYTNQSASLGPGWSSARHQSIASLGTTAIGVTNSFSSTNNFSKWGLSGSTPTASQLTITGVSGIPINCIVARPDTSNRFVLGSGSGTKGKLFEIDGTSLQFTVNLPQTPCTGTIDNFEVSSIAYWNGNLLAATEHGIVFHYAWNSSTQTLVNQYFLGSPSSTGNETIMFSEVVNGMVAILTKSKIGTRIGLFDISTNPIICLDEVALNTTFDSGSTIGLGLVPLWAGSVAISTRGYVYYANTIDDSIWLLGVKGLAPSSVETRSQDPAGVDVTADIFRLRKNPSGLISLESSQSVAAGPVSVNCNFQGYNYYEFARRGSGVSEKFDAREFEA